MFELEPDVHEKRKNGIKLSARTQKEYTAKLNKLEAQGWGNRAALKKNSKAVIAYIKSLYPEDGERPRFNQRFILYAIFWAMDEKYISKSNPYHTYLKKIPPITNSVTKEPWIPLKQYREEHDTN
jgi:hypothetical protein